jgi:hypothetical protein
MSEGVKVLLQFVIVPIVSGATAFGGVWLAQKKQAHQEYLKDQRALRDQKRDRLRALYEKALWAGQAFKHCEQRRMYVFAGETVDQRDESLRKFLAQATKDLDEVQVSLMLDEDGRTILKHLQAVIDGCREYRQIIESPYQHRQEDGITLDDLPKIWEKVEANLKALEETALAHLEELETPIGK